MNSQKNQLFTIHQLSKLTGVPIKALRYYEKIQILQPMYINPENNYRYYGYAQVTYVNIIKLCVNYHIPLKSIHQYLLTPNKIDMQQILSLMQQTIEQQKKQLAHDEAFINNLNNQLDIAKTIHQDQQITLQKQHTDYLMQPFTGELLSAEYYLGIQEMFKQIQSRNIQYYNRMGCYFYYEHQELKKALVLQIEAHTLNTQDLPILHLENYQVTIRHIHKNDCPQMVAPEQIDSQQFLVLETFETPYDMNNPHLELQMIQKN